MSLTLTCKGCKTSLKIRDDLAGKKVKCPRCSKVLTVPGQETVELTELEVLDERIQEGSAGKTRKSSLAKAKDRDREEPPSRQGGIQTKKGAGRKSNRRDEEEDEDERERSGPRYKPCPQCHARGARRVLWTPWGSFYGPALFTHVRCPECGCAYNGRTGRSNLIPAIIFFTVPLLAILGIIGGVFFMLFQRGYLGG